MFTDSEEMSTSSSNTQPKVSLNNYPETFEQFYRETEVSEIAHWNLILGELHRLHLKCMCFYVLIFPHPAVWLGGQGGQQHPALCQQKCGQQD